MFGTLTRLLIVLVPLVEIFLIGLAVHLIGGWPTFLLLVAEMALGLWLVRREGRRAWTRLNASLAEGRMPDRELSDGFLILAGGGLLIVPGFLTGVLGLLCVLPFTRPLVRGLLLRWASGRVAAGGASGVFPGYTPPGDVVRGEVVEEDAPSGATSGPDRVIRGQIVRGDD